MDTVIAQPLANKVILKKEKKIDKTKSGLIVTAASREQYNEAEVLAVGPGLTLKGKKIEMTVRVGDRVIYPKHTGYEMNLKGEEIIIINEDEILVILD